MNGPNETPPAATGGVSKLSSNAHTISPTAPSVKPSIPWLRLEIAERQLGAIDLREDWKRGSCTCPGIRRHTKPNGPHDCVVFLDRVPTIYCVHQSCAAEVARANRELRSAIAKAEGQFTIVAVGEPKIPAVAGRSATRQLSERAKKLLPEILEQHNWPLEEIQRQSPIVLPDDPAQHWRNLLSLYRPDDIIWIGRVPYETGPRCGHGRFRTVARWLQETAAPGKFVCPAVFRAGTVSRGNKAVLAQPYLVVESDILSKDQIGAVFRWAQDFMRLRAIVDTAGKSLHGWFNFPALDVFEELRIILPQFCCDPALFKRSQPVRLPGALRDGRYQKLVWFESGNMG